MTEPSELRFCKKDRETGKGQIIYGYVGSGKYQDVKFILNVKKIR